MLKNINEDYDDMVEKFNISPVLAKFLINRGLKEERQISTYLYSSINEMYAPKHFKDMKKAVDIIKDIIEGEGHIRIVGDYDVDGIMSTYIFHTALKECAANVSYHIPHRITDGYGINEDIIRTAHKDGVDLIITCDNGISAMSQIEMAKELGMKTIITDHHDVPFLEDESGNRNYLVPQADAVVNPKQLDCEYPFKHLCGAGVVFKVIQEVFERLGVDVQEANKYLEYAAIATICDVVDLIDENRIIAKNGLDMLNHTNNKGLRALIDRTGLGSKKISTFETSFIIGPCINSTGRIDSGELSLELLQSQDYEEVRALAQKLYELNEERKNMTVQGFDKAIDIIEGLNLADHKVIVVYIPDIHESIAGIIAGRIKERYHLPTIVLTKSNECVKGSGRSIEAYNMFEELLKCKDLLEKFGGHPMAAGLSLQERNIEEFVKKLNDKCSLSTEDMQRIVSIDMQLPFELITMGLAEEMETLEPFGKGNPRPLFAEKSIRIQDATVLGKNKNVLKLKLVSNTGRPIEAVFFEDIERFNDIIINNFGQREMIRMYNGKDNKIQMDFVFRISINEYMGRRTVQLIVNAYRSAKRVKLDQALDTKL